MTIKRGKLLNLFNFVIALMMTFTIYGQNDKEQSIGNIKPSVNVTSYEEVNDECFLVRFLLCFNEWDVDYTYESLLKLYNV